MAGLSEQAKERRGAEIGYWIYLIVWLVAWVVFCFWLFSASGSVYTYQLPSGTPGTLTSDRWSWDFVRIGLLALWVFVPISGLFMIWTRSGDGVAVHLVVLVLLLIWFAVTFAFDVSDMSRANLAPNDPQFKPYNSATDLRWCCIYGGQPDTERVCANSVACVPPVAAADLGINGDMLFRFTFNLIFIAFGIFDVVYTQCVWMPRRSRWLDSVGLSKGNDVEQALLQQPLRRARYQRK